MQAQPLLTGQAQSALEAATSSSRVGREGAGERGEVLFMEKRVGFGFGQIRTRTSVLPQMSLRNVSSQIPNPTSWGGED